MVSLPLSLLAFQDFGKRICRLSMFRYFRGLAKGPAATRQKVHWMPLRWTWSQSWQSSGSCVVQLISATESSRRNALPKTLSLSILQCFNTFVSVRKRMGDDEFCSHFHLRVSWLKTSCGYKGIFPETDRYLVGYDLGCRPGDRQSHFYLTVSRELNQF